MRHILNRLAWVLAVATSLLVLTFLTGGVRDGPDVNALASDSQPIAISAGDSGAGPQLVCSVPWPVPAGDDDCDGFSTTLESVHLKTLPLCVVGLGSDGWPADLNDDDFSDVSDISALGASFNKSVFGGAPVRHDIAPEAVGDGFVDISDIAQMGQFFGRNAAAAAYGLPICPLP